MEEYMYMYIYEMETLFEMDRSFLFMITVNLVIYMILYKHATLIIKLILIHVRLVKLPDLARTSALDGIDDSGGGNGGSADRIEKVGDFTKSYMFSSSLSLGKCTFSPLELDITLGTRILRGGSHSTGIKSESESGIFQVKSF